MSSIENLYSGREAKYLEIKVFWNILISGKIKPNSIIIAAKVYSWFTASTYVKEITENSDEKNQNSSMVAKGRLTPINNKTNSIKIIGFFNDSLVLLASGISKSNF